MSGLVQKFKEMWAPSEDYYEEDYEEFQDEEESSSNHRERRKLDFSNEKIVKLRSNFKAKVVLTKPERFDEDIKNIADKLAKSYTIILNIEDVPKPDSRRIIDFLSGVTYAHGGKIKKVATDTFVITPCNVDFEGSEIFSAVENSGTYF